ncbi:MAG: serine/threonine-protein kinase [Gammaproteobacteria bacterium]
MDAQIEIPGYRIESLVGKGGMARVYLAVQESLERKVALKIMSSSLAADPKSRERFFKEGRSLAQVSNHPDIVTIYDIGQHKKRYFMAMEFIEGLNLKQRMRKEAKLNQPLAVIRQVASALGYAHTRGFIHRDVKPANILFRENGGAVLTDFGIAKSLNSNTQLTQAGFAVGTPEYMSPEQVLGQSLDARSDLYSLGIVLYEMLSRKKAFAGEDAISTALAHINSPVPKLPGEQTTYQPLIERLLAKKADERFESANELIDYIDDVFGAARGSTTRPVKRRAPGKRKKKTATTTTGAVQQTATWKWGAGAVASLALAVGIGGFVYFGEAGNSAQESNDPGPTPPEAENLLEIAKLNLDRGGVYLTENPVSNACDAFRQVLQMHPGNRDALAGIKQIQALGEDCQPP